LHNSAAPAYFFLFSLPRPSHAPVLRSTAARRCCQALLFVHAALLRVRDFRSLFLSLGVPLRRQEPSSWVLNRAAELRRPRPRRVLSFDGLLPERFVAASRLPLPPPRCGNAATSSL